MTTDKDLGDGPLGPGTSDLGLLSPLLHHLRASEVGGERHADLHLRSSRRTVRGEVRWRDEGWLSREGFGRPDRRPQSRSSPRPCAEPLPNATSDTCSTILCPRYPCLPGTPTNDEPRDDHSKNAPMHGDPCIQMRWVNAAICPFLLQSLAVDFLCVIHSAPGGWIRNR